MYKLENNVEWTTELKNAFKHNITRAKILWSGAEINEQNFLSDLTLEEQRYIPNLGFVGSATAKMVEINLIDSSGTINLENEEFILKLGADYEGDTYYINYGNFIVDKSPEIDATNGKVRIVAYDYMIKFNKPYVNRVLYPCSLLTLLQDVCSQAGVVLGSENFANKNFTIEDNQFEGATLREVLQNIAKCAFSWARIGQDNKLYLDFNLTPDATETITIDDYKTDSFKKANEYYGPINQVTYADSNIEGQEERIKDQESIDENGLKELVIYDNLFAYTTSKKSQLIQAGAMLLGLRYMPISELELIGLAYLDCCDIINIETLDNETFESRVFSHKIQYTGILTDRIVTEGTSDNEEAYKNTATTVFQNQQTRITVDKANKIIQSVVEEVEGQNTKISQITQTVDEINSKISDISDITTSQETTTAKLLMEKIAESEPITVRIRPTGSNISYLQPRSNLFPSSNLFSRNRILRFTNLTEYMQTQDEKYASYKRYYSYNGATYTLLVAGVDYQIGNVIVGSKYENTYFDYEIPMNLLWYDADNYDEFVLDYDNEICQVIKRVQYNSDGTTSLLQRETTYNFDYPQIYLTEGDYEIELLGYAGAYIFVRLMIQNIYGTQWVTKAELSSEISQTKEEISAEVTQTLSGYSTTQQMQSAIDIKAGEISSQVLETYETKGNANANYSRISQTATSLQSQINSNNTDISTLTQTANSLQVQITSNDTDIGRLALNANNLQSQISMNSTDISTLTQTATSLQSQISSNDNDISTLTQTSTSLQSQIVNNKNDLTSLINQEIDKVEIDVGKKYNTSDFTNAKITAKINDGTSNVQISASKISLAGKTINMTSDNIAINSNNFSVDKNGNMTCSNANVSGTITSNNATIRGGSFIISNSAGTGNVFRITDQAGYRFFADGAFLTLDAGAYSNKGISMNTSEASYPYISVYNGSTSTQLTPTGVYPSSRVEVKKNFEKFANAIEKIKQIDIYKYNYKSEEDNQKKHIGFVIGDGYNYIEDVLSEDNKNVDLYSFISLCCGAIKEQQETIEELQKQIKNMKGEDNE